MIILVTQTIAAHDMEVWCTAILALVLADSRTPTQGKQPSRRPAPSTSPATSRQPSPPRPSPSTSRQPSPSSSRQPSPLTHQPAPPRSRQPSSPTSSQHAPSQAPGGWLFLEPDQEMEPGKPMEPGVNDEGKQPQEGRRGHEQQSSTEEQEHFENHNHAAASGHSEERCSHCGRGLRNTNNKISENDWRSYHSDEEMSNKEFDETHFESDRTIELLNMRRRKTAPENDCGHTSGYGIEAEEGRVPKWVSMLMITQDEYRKLFKKTFKVKNDVDYAHYEGATVEEVESWMAGQGPGPSVEDLKLDMEGGIGSEWNVEVMSILMVELKKYCLANGVLKKNPREDVYMRDLLQEKFKQIRKQWQAGQLKANETADKFVMRQRILTAMIEKQTAHSRAMWQWAAEVLNTLGVGGMSSEKSNTDSEDKTECTLKVKKMTWQQNIDKMLHEIDNCQIGANAAGTFAKQGSKLMKRTRQGELMLRREAPAGLPKVLYDQGWLGRRKKWANENTPANGPTGMFELEVVYMHHVTEVLQRRDGGVGDDGTDLTLPSTTLLANAI
ncbi:hypothetical protein BDN71DRAFT_1431203 [Pleurotus eryngii]|uniref:Uncharacterized protein n=1 Tax=Pleurotus eryngii TaxID=5323 RepID=A0A9P5ZZF5_PLEER|nr:hypothetical protein BDN71DRAFT_1431203 [Pleurotus eryngii]